MSEIERGTRMRVRETGATRLVHLFVILTAALLVALPAQAQEDRTADLRTGDWLRVQTHAGERVTGMLIDIVDERLRLTSPGNTEVQFPFDDVARLEVSTGRDRGAGAVVGAGVGLLGGLVLGAVLTFGDAGGEGANMAVIGVPMFTVPAGVLLGALTAPHRYRDVVGF